MSIKDLNVVDNLVSIIMPLYNCQEFIVDSIQSVLSQTYQNWELIIVDDLSTDNSFSVTQKIIKSDSRIQLHQMKKNSGVATVRNYAIDRAKGEYVAFLDCDDLWLPQKLEKQISFMRENSFLFSFTAFEPINESNTEKRGVNAVPAVLDYKGLLKETVIGCLTVMYNSKKIGKCHFDTTLGKHEDYQCWLEILKKIPHAGGLNESLAYYRVRGDSLSSNKFKAASYVWKIIYRYQKLPFLTSVYYFSNYAVKALVKHSKRKR